MPKKAPVERRRHKRFRTRGDAFAMLRPYASILGEIVDVSREGLAIRYLSGNHATNGEGELYALNILLADHSFYFDSVLCKTVSDVEMRGNAQGVRVVPMRRRGVRFVNLTQDQATQLEYFTRNHTDFEAEEDRSMTENK